MTYHDYGRPHQPPVYQQNSSLAVVSLLFGIASFIILPFLGGIAAIISGGMAKKEIRQSAGRLTGWGMASWGTILGWLNIVVGIVLTCLTFFGTISIPICGAIIAYIGGF